MAFCYKVDITFLMLYICFRGKNMQRIWRKLSEEFVLLDKNECLQLNILNDENFVRAYRYENEIVVFNSYKEEGLHFVDLYENQISHVENKIKKLDSWKEVSPINPLYHKWGKIKDKMVYFSLFETYNSDDRISVQIFLEIDNICFGITTAIAKPKNINLNNILNDNIIIKNLIKAII